jgi:hypothetical protein
MASTHSTRSIETHYLPYFEILPISVPFGLTLGRLSVHDLHFAELKNGGGLVPRGHASKDQLRANEWVHLRDYWQGLQHILDRGDPADFKSWCWPLASEKDVAACAKRWKGAKVIAVSNWNPESGKEAMLHDLTLNRGKNHVIEYLEEFYLDEIKRETTFNYFAVLGGLTFIATHEKTNPR